MNTNGTNLMEASRQWANRPADQRFETLNALREAVHNRRMRSAAYDSPLPELRAKVGDSGELLIGNGRKMTPSHWSFGQFAGLIKAPAGYLRTLPTELTAQCLNASLEKAPRDAMKIMWVRGTDDEPTKLQAVTSTTYGRIWDADVVDAIGRIVERTDGKFYNPKAYDCHGNGDPKPSGLYASDHDVFAFMIDGGSMFDAGPRAQLNRGFFCWNSEVGAKTFGLMTFLFNTVCGNHIVWGAQDVTELIVRHSKGGPARFDREAVPVLLDYTQSAPELDAITRAQKIELRGLPVPGWNKESDKWVEWPKAFGRWQGFTKPEVEAAVETAEREEGKCATLWDLVQGFTASAREYEYIDARVDLERRAGKLLQIAADRN